MVGIVWWPSGAPASPDTLLWGVPAWERLVRQMRALGITRVYGAGPAPEHVSLEKPEPSHAALVVAADWVLDSLLLAHLRKSGRALVAVREGRFAGAAQLTERDMARLDLSADVEQVLQLRIEALEIETLPNYRLDMRRRIPIVTLRIATAADAREAERRLLDATQKGTNDLPAQYLHPPLENALVRLFVPLGVTANAVTATTVVVGLLGAFSFFTGRLLTGILLAMVVGVLDGVDGKIARITLTSTSFGNWFDHTTDNVYEILWYLGLGSHLGSSRSAVVLCAFYVLDRIVLGVWKLFREGDFHESSTWDRAFRRVCGRRNNVVFLLAVAIALGRPDAGFSAALVVWAVTFVVHAFRVARALVLGIGERKMVSA